MGEANYYRLQADEEGPRYPGDPVVPPQEPPQEGDEHETVLMMNWWQDDRWSTSKGWQDRKWKPKWTWESSTWTEAPRQVYEEVYDAIATGDIDEFQAACSTAQSSRGRRLSRGRGGKSRGKGKTRGKVVGSLLSGGSRRRAPARAQKERG